MLRYIKKYLIFSGLLVILGAFAAAMPVEDLGQLSPHAIEALSITDLRDREALSFLVFGDAGTGADNQFLVGEAMANVASQQSIDFALVLGDILYLGQKDVACPDGQGICPTDAGFIDHMKQRFEAPYVSLGSINFWGVLGNEDSVYSDDHYTQYSLLSDRWRMPAAHYAVPMLPSWLNIYMMDTDSPNANEIPEAEMEQWRDYNDEQLAALKETCVDSDAWCFTAGHHPVLSTGARFFLSRPIRQVHKELAPGFREAGVHINFSGHEHHIEYIFNRGSFAQSIQGSAAGVRRGIPRKVPADSLMPGNTKFKRYRMGFSVATVSAIQLRLDYYLVDEGGQHELDYSWCGRRNRKGKLAGKELKRAHEQPLGLAACRIKGAHDWTQTENRELDRPSACPIFVKHQRRSQRGRFRSTKFILFLGAAPTPSKAQCM